MELVDHLINRKQASQELAALRASRGISPQKIRSLERDAISRSTWRQYKGALLFVLEQERSAAIDGVVVEELDLALQTLRAQPQSGCLRRTKRTSGMKLKAFPTEDFDAIVGYLEAHVGTHRQVNRIHRHANTLLTWLRASRIVGVRPSEWRSGGLISVDGVAAVCFGNAKVSNGRGNGKERILMLDAATPSDVECIDDMLYMLVEFEKEPGYDAEGLQRKLGDYLHKVTRRCLGKRSSYPTMYSLRHQFAADAKACCSREEVAALLGHGVDDTATNHYGRKTAAQGPIKVSPVASQVATVRRSRKAGFRPARKPGSSLV
jgi:integrase